MKWIYNVFDVSYELFEQNINEAGKKGWELIEIVPMQQFQGMNLDQTPRIKSFLKCVFMKPDPNVS